MIQRGCIDPEPELSFYLSAKEEEIKDRFRGTAMGMKWFSGKSMIRNAILSLTPESAPPFSGRLADLCDSEDEGIKDAARWVMKRVRPDREQ